MRDRSRRLLGSRLGPAVLGVALLAAGVVTTAQADTGFELRTATSGYRFADVSHQFSTGLVLDAVYYGEPGFDELYLGVGWDLSTVERASVVPILYAVKERNDLERGMTLATLVWYGGPRWEFLGFVGHFVPVGCECEAYTFADSLDLTRKFGPWAFGGSLTVDGFEDSGTWRLGPMMKWNDGLGAWAASLRYGEAGAELRVMRTFELPRPSRAPHY